MFKKLLKGIGSVFGFDGVGKSALKIVDKIAGTDWLPAEKAKFMLDWVKATAYQSTARRLIAFAFISEWMLMANMWLYCSYQGRINESKNHQLLAGDITEFMASNINVTVSVVVGFYFLLNMKKS